MRDGAVDLCESEGAAVHGLGGGRVPSSSSPGLGASPHAEGAGAGTSARDHAAVVRAALRNLVAYV